MYQLKPDHRRVLSLRCYDEMQFSEIAELMKRTDFGTRMLFFRAKKALQKRLARNGMAKGTLVTALVVFGKLTASSEASLAQVSIVPATLKVGTAAGLAAAATSATGLVSIVAATGITIGASVALPDSDSQSLQPEMSAKVQYVETPSAVNIAENNGKIKYLGVL